MHKQFLICSWRNIKEELDRFEKSGVRSKTDYIAWPSPTVYVKKNSSLCWLFYWTKQLFKYLQLSITKSWRDVGKIKWRKNILKTRFIGCISTNAIREEMYKFIVNNYN